MHHKLILNNKNTLLKDIIEYGATSLLHNYVVDNNIITYVKLNDNYNYDNDNNKIKKDLFNLLQTQIIIKDYFINMYLPVDCKIIKNNNNDNYDLITYMDCNSNNINNDNINIQERINEDYYTKCIDYKTKEQANVIRLYLLINNMFRELKIIGLNNNKKISNSTLHKLQDIIFDNNIIYNKLRNDSHIIDNYTYMFILGCLYIKIKYKYNNNNIKLLKDIKNDEYTFNNKSVLNYSLLLNNFLKTLLNYHKILLKNYNDKNIINIINTLNKTITIYELIMDVVYNNNNNINNNKKYNKYIEIIKYSSKPILPFDLMNK